MKDEITTVTVNTDGKIVDSKPCLFEGIIKSLEIEPQNWVQTEHTLMNKNTRLEIWTANWQPFNLDIFRPQKIKIPFMWKLRIWKAIKKRPFLITMDDLSPKEEK